MRLLALLLLAACATEPAPPLVWGQPWPSADRSQWMVRAVPADDPEHDITVYLIAGKFSAIRGETDDLTRYPAAERLLLHSREVTR